MTADLKRIHWPTIVAVAGTLGACASSPEAPHPTQPQVTISGTSVDRVKTALVSEMARRKFHVGKEAQFEIPFEQPASHSVLQGLSAADAGGNPTERIIYTLAPEGGDIRVVAEVYVVRRLAAMERPVDISQGPEGQTVQGILDKIASEVGTPKPAKRD
jgi:hypothetical protein